MQRSGRSSNKYSKPPVISLYFASQEPDFAVFSKCFLTIVIRPFWRSFKVSFGHFLLLHSFSVQFLEFGKLRYTDLWIAHPIKGSKLKGWVSVVSTHDRELREPVLDDVFRHFVMSSLSQKCMDCLSCMLWNNWIHLWN